MTIASFLLVVLAAFIHASWNLLSKRAAGAGPTFVFFYNLIACVAYAPWALWLLAHGGPNYWNWAVAICVGASGLIHLAYNLCLQRGYQVADLSVVYPIARGTAPMLSSACAFLLLGEIPTGLRLGGLFAVVAGIALISTQGDLTAFRKSRGSAGVGWGLATGSLIASYTVVDAYAVRVLGVAPVVLDWCSNLLCFALIAPALAGNAARARDVMQGKWWPAIGVGLLSPLAYILVLAAIELGAPVSVVAPAREMSMMVGALFGMLILHERVGPWRVVGCAVLMAGTLMLGVS